MRRSGSRELHELLANMEPELEEGEFVYCTIPPATPHPDLHPLCVFREAEGDTLIVRRPDAEVNHIAFSFVFRKITLRVHSALEAVGFLAKIAGELAGHGISTNCVSAFYHDHLFVPADKAEHALALLRDLQRSSRGT